MATSRNYWRILYDFPKICIKKLSLEELVFGALSQLQTLQYHNRSIRRYQSTWKRLIKFANEHDCKNELSQKLIADFLEYYEIKPDLPAYAYHGWRKHAEFSLKMLWNYSRSGYFERCQMILKRLFNYFQYFLQTGALRN